MGEFLLQSLLLDNHNKYGSKIAIIDDLGDFTYSQIYYSAVKVASYIQSEPSTSRHIGILFNNNTQFVIAFFGVLMAGKVVVPFPTNLSNTELDAYIEKCDVITIISEYECPDNYHNNDLNWLDINKILLTEFTSDISEEMTTISDESVAIMLPTSGSTGSPKIVMLSHQSVYENAFAHQLGLGIGDDDILLVTMPVSFSSTITTQIIASFINRATIYLARLPLLSRRALNILKTQKITCLALVPTFLYQLIITLQNHESLEQIVGDIKIVTISGASLSEEVFIKAKSLFKNSDVIQTYGLTEASPRVTMMERGDKRLSCGKPVNKIKLKIIDINSGRPQTCGGVGEVFVNGPNLMLGYYKDEKLTKMTVIDGWLRTGDIGYIDSYGNLIISGRIKNIIIIGGINISPEEIEQVIIRETTFINSAVIGINDEVYGEVPVAIIEGVPTDVEQEKKRILKACKKELSAYKVPKEVFFIPEFPLTRTGKINRVELNNIINKVIER